MWASVKEKVEKNYLEKREKNRYGFEVPPSPFYPCCYVIQLIPFIQQILHELYYMLSAQIFIYKYEKLYKMIQERYSL